MGSRPRPPTGSPVSSAAVDDLTRLLEAARAGDRLAFGAFVRSSQADVWRLAAHLVDARDADDVTQDVYLRAWRALPAFRGESSARTWVLAIARRTCADELRRRHRSRRLRARLEREHEEPALPDAAGRHSAFTLLGLLADDRREAFVLTQIVGCSYEEAAAVCGVPVGTIRSRVARARGDLVEALAAADAS
jgi:RNA polymerase sigma-70 factor (ECF subfamily)